MSHEKHEHHIVSYKTFFTILVILLCLTGITVGAAHLHLGKLSIWISLLIASTKATLVLSIFMHLKYEKPALRRMFYATVFFLAIIIGFTFLDVAFRV